MSGCFCSLTWRDSEFSSSGSEAHGGRYTRYDELSSTSLLLAPFFLEAVIDGSVLFSVRKRERAM